jgi:D-tyrosyl-tRNA(Tyr) deacylase
MKAVLQRVQRGQVSVEAEIAGKIETGFVILLGVTHNDGEAEAKKLAEKTAHLRVFEDEQGKMNRSVLDVDGEVLVVSQFTLYADAKKGRRPSFTRAAPPNVAEPLIGRFVELLLQLGVKNVQTGVFGANMLVTIDNDGPVTIILDTAEL